MRKAGTDMDILFTICGRAGSKGIKNKNLREFLGYPLPFYTVSAIDLYQKKHPQIHTDISLNTDSQDLINLFKNNLDIEFDVIQRDKKLSLDTTPKVPVILNCLNEMEKRKMTNYDMVVDLDITSPLRRLEDLEALIEKKIRTSTDLVFSVTNARRNPYFNMVKKTESGYSRVIKSNFNSRQEAPEIFDMNASLYAYAPSFLRSEQNLFDGNCEIIKMLDTAVLDIDHENDFELMEVVAAYLFNTNEEYEIIQKNIKECTKVLRT